MAEVAGEDELRRLRVDLRVVPSDDWDCPIVTETDDATDVSINAVGDSCAVDIQPSDEEGVIRASGTVSDDCLCQVLQRFGCVPHVRRVEDGAILFTIYVDDREVVREVVVGLREILERVQLVRLAVVDGPDATEQVTFDLASLTPKQREGLELAVARGYFDGDGDVRLGDLAAEIDISKSALSQRLRTAQAKLVTDVFDEAER